MTGSGLLFDGVEKGLFEIVADKLRAQVKAGLAAPIEVLYPQLQQAPQ